jgi:hypothetical protein
MGTYSSKWGAGISNEQRCKALKGCINVIQTEAKKQGFTASYFEMARILRAQGVNVSDTYVYMHFAGIASRYPFPFEVIILLCEGYRIPLSTVFSSDVLK